VPVEVKETKKERREKEVVLLLHLLSSFSLLAISVLFVLCMTLIDPTRKELAT
jgi:hypothetical protein